MKRIIGVGLIALLAFTAIGALLVRMKRRRPIVIPAPTPTIFCYFDNDISKADLQNYLRAILSAEGVEVLSVKSDSVTTKARPGTGPPPDPYRPADLTPWDMIKRYAASQNSGDICTPTFTVTIPSNIRTYGGRTYTVANMNYDAVYCNALAQWERTQHLYTDAERPPRPTPSQ